ATGNLSLAAGHQAVAGGTQSTALGKNANAAQDNSTALGFGATTTAANQVTLGGAGSSVRIGDIAASTAAQTGTVGVATVDASGTLGRDTTIFPAVQTLQATSATQGAAIAAIQTVNTTQSTQIAALQAAGTTLSGRIDDLFDLRDLDRRDSQQGIAAAVAFANPAMPSAPGRTSYVVNVATFRGEQAVSAGIMHRIGGGMPFAISAGFSFAGNSNNAARVGVAGEF
ncbi:MAG: hypothetical protein ACXWU2_09505, partial [Allosphingosinicella sp.]